MAHSANDNRPTAATDHSDETQHYPFETLPFTAQLLVWGMRQWVSALKSGGDFASLTGDGFAQFGLGDAGQALDDLFQVVAVSARRQIDIRCVKCRFVSEDEILLIDCLGAAQEGQFSLAYAGLLEILPPAATRHVMPTLIAMAKFFSHAGLAITSQKTPAELDRRDRPAAAEARGKQTRRLLQHAAENLAGLEIPALVH
jgi:hypothetical protein